MQKPEAVSKRAPLFTTWFLCLQQESGYGHFSGKCWNLYAINSWNKAFSMPWYHKGDLTTQRDFVIILSFWTPAGLPRVAIYSIIFQFYIDYNFSSDYVLFVYVLNIISFIFNTYFISRHRVLKARLLAKP